MNQESIKNKVRKTGIIKISLISLFFAVVIALFVLNPPTSHGFNMGYHFDIIREVMLEEGFGEDAYRVALLANAYVDLFQPTETILGSTFVVAGAMTDDTFAVNVHQLQDILHFDGLPSKNHLDAYYKRFISNAYEAFKSRVEANDVRGALMIMGITFHIIQDFYAHSNWVELDVGKYVNIPDASYFDLFWRPEVLAQAIRDNHNLNLRRYGEILAEDDLFTHAYLPDEGVVHNIEGRDCTVTRRPSHDTLQKDYAGRPYFDWAYRAAYRATRQWLFLMKTWAIEIRNPALWTSMKNYHMPTSHNYRRDLYTATNFDGGTFYWIFSMAGAWKKPGNWGTWDMLTFDLPNVRGIGITEQASNIPFLGADFFNNCSLIARNLFELKEDDPHKGKIERLSYISGSYSRDVNLGYTIENSLYLGGLNLTAIPRDYPNNYLALSLVGRPKGWLKVQLPRVTDRNPHGTWSYNNEDPATQSDYYAKFYINNRLYIETEYVDNENPETMWQVLKPLWNLDEEVEIKVEIWESDFDRSNEQMHISPTTVPVQQFPLTYNPRVDNFSAFPMGDKRYIEYYDTPGVRWVTSMGTDADWGARIYLGVGLLSDYNRLEVVVSTADTRDAGTDDLVWLNVGAYTFLLNRSHHDEFQRGATDIFTFDPGREWKPEKLHMVRLSKDFEKNDNWSPTSLKVVADKNYYLKAERIARVFDNLSNSMRITPIDEGRRVDGVEQVSWNFGEIIKTYEFPDEVIKTISVVSEVYAQARGAPGTRDKVYLEFKDKDGNLFQTTIGRSVFESRYHLTNSLRKLLRHNPSEFTHKRDNDYFYYLSRAPLLDKQIKDIDQIVLDKPGRDDLSLIYLSVWINDKLLCASTREHELGLTSGRTSWAYTVLKPPDKPRNISPEAGARGIVLRPTLVASAFSDPQRYLHYASEWRIIDETGREIYRVVTGAVTSHTITTDLQLGKLYRWQLRYANRDWSDIIGYSRGLWSPWSELTHFYTNTPPLTPINQSPAAGATGISLTPRLSASLYSDSENHTHQRTEWRVSYFSTPTSFDVNTGELIGVSDAFRLITIPVISWEIPRGSSLRANTRYFWQVRYEDSMGLWSKWSSPTTFTTRDAVIPPPPDIIIPPIILININQPTAGAVWEVGTTREIRWSTTGTGISYINISLSTDGGRTFTSISTRETNDGVYRWNVPRTPTTNAMVRVTAHNERGELLATGDSASFTIKETIPLSVKVILPNGGEEWLVDSPQEIIWKTTGEGIAYIGLYYSTDAGKSMRAISSREVNDGVFSWIIPNTPSTSSMVRVIAYNNKGEVLALGDSELFTIKEKILLTLVVLTPNGGEFWFINSKYNITWKATGEEIATLDISYSVDGGKTWITIITGLANTGSYAWTIPNTPSTSSLMRIQARDKGGKLIMDDVSDKYFTILRGQN